jgi:excisionase family DNA binding protein
MAEQLPIPPGHVALAGLASELGVSQEWLRKLARQGELPASRVGRFWYIPATAADELRARYRGRRQIPVTDAESVHHLRVVGEGELPVGVISELLAGWRERIADLEGQVQRERRRAESAEHSLAALRDEVERLRRAVAEQPNVLLAEVHAAVLRAQRLAD